MLVAVVVIRFSFLWMMTHLSDEDEATRTRLTAYWSLGSTSQSRVGRVLIFRDAGAYLTISESGYQPNDWYSAFYPLWPFLIQPIITQLPEPSIPLGAWLLANGLTILGSLFLFLLVARRWGEDCAWTAVLLQNSFPAAFFLYLPFTEPLFFFLFGGLLWALDKRFLLLAALACFLLPLTRPVGILLLPGVALWTWTNGRNVAFRLGLPFVMLAGFAAYLGCIYYFTGNAFEGFAAQQLHVNQPSLAYLLSPWLVFKSFFAVSSFLGPTEGLLDRLCFLAVLVGLAALWKFNRIWWFMVVPMAILPAITNLFLSYRRFMVLLVPLTIAVAHYGCGSARRKIVLIALCAIGCVVQIIQIWEHVNGRWAG